MKSITLKCTTCGKEFKRNINNYKYNLKKKYNSFCSQECSNLAKSTTVTVFCEICNKQLLRQQSRIKKNKSGKSFCSNKCASIYNNKIRANNKKSIMTICVNCGKEIKNITKYKRKFCDVNCQNEHEHSTYIARWKNGDEHGYYNGGNCGLNIKIRRYIFNKYDNKCHKCGWCDVNPTSRKIPLTINHIDGKAKNCKEENLELICPNCHSLTPNYGSLNENSDRNRKD